MTDQQTQHIAPSTKTVNGVKPTNTGNYLLDLLTGLRQSLDEIRNIELRTQAVELRALRDDVRSLIRRGERPKSETEAIPKTPENSTKLYDEIIGATTIYWSEHSLPAPLRLLSQKFSKRLKRLGKPLNDVLHDLEMGERIITLYTLAGATLVFTPEAYATLDDRALDTFRNRSLSQSLRQASENEKREAQASAKAQIQTSEDAVEAAALADWTEKGTLK